MLTTPNNWSKHYHFLVIHYLNVLVLIPLKCTPILYYEDTFDGLRDYEIKYKWGLRNDTALAVFQGYILD